jgi:hypothetical protein
VILHRVAPVNTSWAMAWEVVGVFRLMLRIMQMNGVANGRLKLTL